MKPISGTLPEPKLQSTKKKPAQQVATPKPSAPMSTVAATKEEKAQMKARKTGNLIRTYWPMLVAVFISGFAPEWHTMAVASGVWALRFTFPYTLLAQNFITGIDSVMPNASIFMQIPIDGAYISFTLARGRSLTSGIIQVLLIHSICTLILSLQPYM